MMWRITYLIQVPGYVILYDVVMIYRALIVTTEFVSLLSRIDNEDGHWVYC